jgi:hypothetical protein
MAATLGIEFDQKVASDLMRAVKRDAKYTGGTLGKSLGWAGVNICKSLGALTPQGKQKLRKVITNPDERWKRDNRMARFGVMRLFQDKPAKFLPIKGTGEFGAKIRFKSKTTGEMLTRTPDGKVHRLAVALGTGPDQVPGIMQSKKRIIGKRGMAKRSWKLLQMRMGRGGYIVYEGVPDLGDVTLKSMKTDPTITIRNRISYMMKIIKGGSAALNSAMASAEKGMVYQIENNIRKKMKTT